MPVRSLSFNIYECTFSLIKDRTFSALCWDNPLYFFGALFSLRLSPSLVAANNIICIKKRSKRESFHKNNWDIVSCICAAYHQASFEVLNAVRIQQFPNQVSLCMSSTLSPTPHERCDAPQDICISSHPYFVWNFCHHHRRRLSRIISLFRTHKVLQIALAAPMKGEKKSSKREEEQKRSR